MSNVRHLTAGEVAAERRLLNGAPPGLDPRVRHDEWWTAWEVGDTVEAWWWQRLANAARADRTVRKSGADMRILATMIEGEAAREAAGLATWMERDDRAVTAYRVLLENGDDAGALAMRQRQERLARSGAPRYVRRVAGMKAARVRHEIEEQQGRQKRAARIVKWCERFEEQEDRHGLLPDEARDQLLEDAATIRTKLTKAQHNGGRLLEALRDVDRVARRSWVAEAVVCAELCARHAVSTGDLPPHAHVRYLRTVLIWARAWPAELFGCDWVRGGTDSWAAETWWDRGGRSSLVPWPDTRLRDVEAALTFIRRGVGAAKPREFTSRNAAIDFVAEQIGLSRRYVQIQLATWEHLLDLRADMADLPEPKAPAVSALDAGRPSAATSDSRAPR